MATALPAVLVALEHADAVPAPVDAVRAIRPSPISITSTIHALTYYGRARLAELGVDVDTIECSRPCSPAPAWT